MHHRALNIKIQLFNRRDNFVVSEKYLPIICMTSPVGNLLAGTKRTHNPLFAIPMKISESIIVLQNSLYHLLIGYSRIEHAEQWYITGR